MFRPIARPGRLAWLGCVSLSLFLAGCSSKTTSGQDEGQANMQRLMRLVMKHRQKNMGSLPANDADLKKFATGLKADELKELDIVEVDACFVSPRDKKPYAFNFSIQDAPATDKLKGGVKKPSGSMKPPLLAWEQEGSGGKRYVLFAQGGSVVLMSDAEFNEHMGK